MTIIHVLELKHELSIGIVAIFLPSCTCCCSPRKDLPADLQRITQDIEGGRRDGDATTGALVFTKISVRIARVATYEPDEISEIRGQFTTRTGKALAIL